ncbi:PHD finger protein 12, partial [Geodia barretti]
MAEQQEEGLLEKIYALVAPPQTAMTGKQKGKKARSLAAPPPSQPKHTGIENNPFCNACGDGGSLLCCDNCPASFHFYCCDPPVDPKDLPSGEWLCRSCSSVPPPHSTPPLFRPLLEQATSANPLIFRIPEELKSTELLPGLSKRKFPAPRGAKADEKYPSQKLCFACNKRVVSAQVTQCDFCPLHFHLSCVDPPLTTPPATAWMCPLHPHHSIPDFEHPRLSRRLRALEKGREEVHSTKVKLDFLSKISRIPHYKRVTRHLNRRVAQVPPAVKALYSDPFPEACETPPLTESLVSAAEVCQWWRGEEEKRRREFAAISSSSSSSLSPPSQHVDKWTRDAIVRQMNRHRVDTPPFPRHSHHANQSLHNNEAVLLAATQLLELSRRNGVTKLRDLCKPDNRRRRYLNVSSSKDEMVMKGAVNGFGDEDRDSVHEGERWAEGGRIEEDREDEGEMMEVESGENGDNGEIGEGEREEDGGEVQMKEEIKDIPLCVPDTSLLDRRLVQLLASQRLHQLFGHCHGDEKTTGAPPHEPNHSVGKGINGIHSVLFPQLAKPTPTPEDLRTAQSVLCPISGVGTAFAVHKHVTLIGTGSGVDLPLSHYGHCNYLSPRHACIFYNKACLLTFHPSSHLGCIVKTQ